MNCECCLHSIGWEIVCIARRYGTGFCCIDEAVIGCEISGQKKGGLWTYASRKGLNSEGRPGWGSQFEKSMATDAIGAPTRRRRRQEVSVFNMMGKIVGILRVGKGDENGGELEWYRKEVIECQ